MLAFVPPFGPRVKYGRVDAHLQAWTWVPFILAARNWPSSFHWVLLSPLV